MTTSFKGENNSSSAEAAINLHFNISVSNFKALFLNPLPCLCQSLETSVFGKVFHFEKRTLTAIIML
jgi:hypothetical protein